jgi:sugar lactone lactonase YvrE
MISTPTHHDTITAGDITGEGILWDSRRHLLWWTDIQRSRLYRHDWATRTTRVLPAPERIGSFGLVKDSERLIVAFASGIAFYDPFSQHVEWLARPSVDTAHLRFNDGRVDRAGRFWAGTMDERRVREPVGALFSYDRVKGLVKHRDGVFISNGLCMSPDGSRLYFADTPARTIDVYELHPTEGTLGECRVFARIEDNAAPDGGTVDSQGYVWNAQWGGSRVVRYAPDGSVDLTLAVPTCQPTCVCFGGPDLDMLFVTSAVENLDEATRLREPNAGDVFVYRTVFKGLPEQEYLP